MTAKKYFTLTLIALAMPSLASNTTLEIEQNTITKNNQAIEVMRVVGQRNQVLSEPTEQTEKLMAVAGIAGDPLSSVFSLPGIVYAGGDDGGEPAIRGSSPDDNAFYIDDVPVDYIFHLFGDSIFNKNLVRDFNLEPAAFGANYGNAIGGIFDVKLRDPRHQPLSYTFDWSMMKTGFLVEGSVTENSAFYASYRRSMMHLFLGKGDELEDNIKIYQPPKSDDYQIKYQWLVGETQKLTMSLNGANDSGGINIAENSEIGLIDPDAIGDLSLDTGFNSASLQWEYFAANNDYINVLVSSANSEETEKIGAGQFQQVEDKSTSIRARYVTDLTSEHRLSIGSDILQHDIDYSFDLIPYYCTEHDADCIDRKGDRISDTAQLKYTDYGVYVADMWQISPSIRTEIGLRAERNDYTEQSFVHPRLIINWQATSDAQITAKVGSYSRFPDVEKAVRIIGNPELESPQAIHSAVKLDYQIQDDWQTSVELYHKKMTELPVSVFVEEGDDSPHFINGMKGQAYGIEWVLEKALTDNWYGWASISWSKSDRTDERTGITTEYYLDTPLILNMVLNYQLNDRWSFGGRLTGRSGAKYTKIIGTKPNPDYPEHVVPVYGELNGNTLPVYHRLDLQAEYSYELFGKPAKWTFALLNALNAKNVSGYYLSPKGESTAEGYEVVKEEGMAMFPSIGFEINF